MKKKALAIIISLCLCLLGAAGAYAANHGKSDHDNAKKKSPPHSQPAHKPPPAAHKPAPAHKPPAHKPPAHHGLYKPPSSHYNHGKYRGSNTWNSRHGHFRPGYALPPYYHQNRSRYLVHDWRRYGLYDPPPGHQWLQIDNNFVLMGIATGLVAHILMGD